MAEKPLRILYVSTADIGGGAEKIALDLLRSSRMRGIESRLSVGVKRSDDPHVLLMPRVSNANNYKRWTLHWLSLANKFSYLEGRVRGARRLLALMRIIAQPRILLETYRGHEDFEFPGSWHVLDLLSERPDILHCHNLHGGFFDLRALATISRRVPTVLTLHDTWLLSGHCAYSFECERWIIGCGMCPDLTIYPAIKRDATAYNWERKKEIYAKSRLYISTPSQWLMNKVERSMLAPAIVEARIIHNSVDLAVFHPCDHREVRAELGIPLNAKVLLFVGYHVISNKFKDYSTVEAAVKQVAERLPHERLILICLGQEQKAGCIGKAEVLFIPYKKDPKGIARYYQAADCYVHASKEEVWGLTITEALACGKPVVATAVGGIPEQVKDGRTGYLVPPKDVEGMAKRIMLLLINESLHGQFSRCAAQDARERFDLNHQADAYMQWYRTIAEASVL